MRSSGSQPRQWSAESKETLGSIPSVSTEHHGDVIFDLTSGDAGESARPPPLGSHPTVTGVESDAPRARARSPWGLERGASREVVLVPPFSIVKRFPSESFLGKVLSPEPGSNPDDVRVCRGPVIT